jgi:hypothetical protein
MDRIEIVPISLEEPEKSNTAKGLKQTTEETLCLSRSFRPGHVSQAGRRRNSKGIMTNEERNAVLEEAARHLETWRLDRDGQAKHKVIPYTVYVPGQDGFVVETVEVQVPLKFDTELGVWELTPEAHLIIESKKAERIKALKG